MFAGPHMPWIAYYTRYGFCYQMQNPQPEAEFFYLTLGTQKNPTLGGSLHPYAINAQVTPLDIGIVNQTPQMHKVLTSRLVFPGCRLPHQIEVYTTRCMVYFQMEMACQPLFRSTQRSMTILAHRALRICNHLNVMNALVKYASSS